MRNSAFITATMMAVALAACGGSEPREVVEQIVVREPGESAAVSSTPAEGTVDLVAAGEAAFAMCTGCHVAEEGEPSAAGPNLYAVVGREAGARDDFAYSEALAGSGITWDEAQLDRYLADPTGTVPGTLMAAGAVTDDDRRAAIIGYLASLSE